MNLKQSMKGKDIWKSLKGGDRRQTYYNYIIIPNIKREMKIDLSNRNCSFFFDFPQPYK